LRAEITEEVDEYSDLAVIPEGMAVHFPYSCKASLRKAATCFGQTSAVVILLSCGSFYIQLVEIEAAFKNLKDDLALCPIFHQLEHRIEAHIFVAFMAYCT
jgi:hypothetical protein